MQNKTQLGYAIGFLVALLLVAYGFVPSYDQLRLGLAASGVALAIIVILAWLVQADDEHRLKKMKPYEIEKLRPDLQIASRETVVANILNPQEQERYPPKTLSLEERYPQFRGTKPVDAVSCARCNLYIPPGTGWADQGIMYHRDCYKTLYPNTTGV